MSDARSFPPGLAVVIGGSGGIGSAVADELESSGQFSKIVRLSRQSSPAIDLTDESTISAAAQTIQQTQIPVRLILVATGLLGSHTALPEKSLRDLDAAALAQQFAINAIGPALVAKHFLPLLAREGRTVFAALSARVGSIGDNRLGGWYGYRASKAALNQIVRTAAIEMTRVRPSAVCVALHPGTVATPLSARFAKSQLEVQSPSEAARKIIAVIEALKPTDTGGFFDQHSNNVPW